MGPISAEIDEGGGDGDDGVEERNGGEGEGGGGAIRAVYVKALSRDRIGAHGGARRVRVEWVRRFRRVPSGRWI